MAGESPAISAMLTKNIFQIHESYRKLGAFERVCLERWKLMNPEWDYRFTTNDEADAVVKELIPDDYSRYKQFHLGAKNNIRRCAMLHKYGGLYADLDLYPVHPLRDYLPTDRQRVLFKYDDRDMWLNGIFASAEGDPMTLGIIREATRRLTHGPSAPPQSDTDDWMSWHFDMCGVHCFNEVYQLYEKIDDAITGGDSHPDYNELPVDQVKCLHLGTGCWIPRDEPFTLEQMTLREFYMLDAAKEVFGI